MLRAAGVPGRGDSRRWAGGPNLRASIQAGGCTLTWAGVHLESLLRTGVDVLHRAGIQVHHSTMRWASVGARSLSRAGRRGQAGQLALRRHLSARQASLKEKERFGVY